MILLCTSHMRPHNLIGISAPTSYSNDRYALTWLRGSPFDSWICGALARTSKPTERQ